MKHYFYMLFTLELYFQNCAMQFIIIFLKFVYTRYTCFIFVVYMNVAQASIISLKKSHSATRKKKKVKINLDKRFIMNMNIYCNRNCWAI